MVQAPLLRGFFCRFCPWSGQAVARETLMVLARHLNAKRLCRCPGKKAPKAVQKMYFILY